MNINVTVGDDETIYCNVQLITPVVNIGMIGIKGDTGGIPSSGIPVSNGTDWVDSITATAESDFILSGPSPFSWVKKTLAQVKTILGLGAAAYGGYATAAEITAGLESAKAIAPDQLALSNLRAGLAASGANADITSMTGLDDDGIPVAKVAGALANIVEDTTPELGGELDAGAHSIGFTQQSATGDGETTINWKLGNKFKFTFGAQNETFTFTAPSNPCNLLLMLVQDATGSRTATWPATVKWAGGSAPTLSTGANAVDIVSAYFDGTSYYGQASLKFS